MISPQRRFVLEASVLLVLSVVVTFFSVRNEWAAPLDQLLYDFYISRYSAPQHPDIVIVSIDDASLHAYGPWPWPRDLQARLLRAIGSRQPLVTAVDVIYAGTTELDSHLNEAAAELPFLALPLMVERLGAGRQHVEVLPYPDLLAQTDAVGHVHVELDDDAVVRGTYLFQGLGVPLWPHLMQVVAARVSGDTPEPCVPATAGTARVTGKCNYARLPFAGPPGTYPQVPAQLLLQPDASQAPLLQRALQNKIVLVGLTATGAGDWVTSPTSPGGDHAGPMSGVEFNANLLSALLYNNLIHSPAYWWAVFIACGLTALCSLTLPRLRPKQMLLLTAVLTVVPALITLAALWRLHIYVPLATASVAVLIIYPLWSWRRHEIAWSFIQEELDRIDSESRQWQSLTHWRGEAQSEAQLTAHLQLMLQQDIDPARAQPDSLSPAQQALLRDVGARLEEEQPRPALPGEILAAQIRTLQYRARDVREGRAIGLAGLGRMNNGALIISAMGEIRFANSAAVRLLNIQEGAAPAKLLDLLSVIQPPLGQTWPDIMRHVVLLRQPVAFEGNVAGVPVYVAAEPLPAGSRPDADPDTGDAYAPHWVLTLSDLTAVRDAQAQREEALAFLSHDIRSPLLSVLALIRGSNQNSPLLEKISAYTQKGLSTSDQFLQLSRLQLHGDFERYDLELGQVIHNAVEQAYFLAREKNITLSMQGLLDDTQVDAASWEGLWLTANGELLERALDNLLSNAIKYSNPGTRITVSLARQDGAAVIKVADQGYGIPAEELSEIFEPYFRSSAQELAENRGAGLGLRLVKTVIDRHHGTVQVDSERGKGTVFTLTLPLAQDASTTANS